jgi:hypothetical protein
MMVIMVHIVFDFIEGLYGGNGQVEHVMKDFPGSHYALAAVGLEQRAGFGFGYPASAFAVIRPAYGHFQGVVVVVDQHRGFYVVFVLQADHQACVDVPHPKGVLV